MILKRGFLMFLTNVWFEPNIFQAKTMACNPLNVNDGNNKKHRSHARSHATCLNNKNIFMRCEQVNNFSCAYVRNYFSLTAFSYLPTTDLIFIFFLSVCVSVLLFTYSHLIKINIKTIAYHVNDLKITFTGRSHDSHEG